MTTSFYQRELVWILSACPKETFPWNVILLYLFVIVLVIVIVIVIVMQGMESEIDSELSSLFSYDRDIKNLHLISPLEYAAMLKQVGAGVTGHQLPAIYINL